MAGQCQLSGIKRNICYAFSQGQMAIATSLGMASATTRLIPNSATMMEVTAAWTMLLLTSAVSANVLPILQFRNCDTK